MTPRRRRGISGVTVYLRGDTWSYRIDLEPHALTGARQRENRGGFATEDEAWTDAIKAKAALDAGRRVKPSQRRVREVAAEWLESIEHSVKPSTYTNYVDYLDAYVLPAIGDRKIQEISVTTLNTLYRHLLENGRAKPNVNGAMYVRWKSAADAGKERSPRQLATETGAMIHAAREPPVDDRGEE